VPVKSPNSDGKLPSRLLPSSVSCSTFTPLHRTPFQFPSGQGLPSNQFCLSSQDDPPVDSYNALSAMKDDDIGVGSGDGLGVGEQEPPRFGFPLRS